MGYVVVGDTWQYGMEHMVVWNGTCGGTAHVVVWVVFKWISHEYELVQYQNVLMCARVTHFLSMNQLPSVGLAKARPIT